MRVPAIDVDAVTSLLTGVARDQVMPKFNALGADEILGKPTAGNLDDIVTVVDREVEDALTRALQDLLPSSRVVGEEAAHADPTVLELVQGDGPVWIVDPLDGTSNFAAGNDGFGIMVGLAVAGEVRHAWLHLPARGDMFVAEAGCGAFLNGVRIHVPDGTPAQLRGSVMLRYMPDAVRASVRAATEGRYRIAAHSGAAVIEYTDVVRGTRDFAVYYRLLPWDHGAPALVLAEAGGCASHLDGRRYSVRSADQIMIVARNQRVAGDVRSWLEWGIRL